MLLFLFTAAPTLVLGAAVPPPNLDHLGIVPRAEQSPPQGPLRPYLLPPFRPDWPVEPPAEPNPNFLFKSHLPTYEPVSDSESPSPSPDIHRELTLASPLRSLSVEEILRPTSHNKQHSTSTTKQELPMGLNQPGPALRSTGTTVKPIGPIRNSRPHQGVRPYARHRQPIAPVPIHPDPWGKGLDDLLNFFRWYLLKQSIEVWNHDLHLSILRQELPKDCKSNPSIKGAMTSIDACGLFPAIAYFDYNTRKCVKRFSEQSATLRTFTKTARKNSHRVACLVPYDYLLRAVPPAIVNHSELRWLSVEELGMDDGGVDT